MPDLLCSNDASASPQPPSSRRRAAMTTLAEWFTLAWALWWSWAYVQTALARRFPEWLGWTTRLW